MLASRVRCVMNHNQRKAFIFYELNGERRFYASESKVSQWLETRAVNYLMSMKARENRVFSPPVPLIVVQGRTQLMVHRPENGDGFVMPISQRSMPM
ncbi:MAG: hypothetical protein OXI30_07625 [Chloroflexota bacterium]|nr:hypothetical protein [Chloroflexota bacterium]MYD08365.1 hypothetical protein [Acidimicrobiaceae bacterium]